MPWTPIWVFLWLLAQTTAIPIQFHRAQSGPIQQQGPNLATAGSTVTPQQQPQLPPPPPSRSQNYNDIVTQDRFQHRRQTSIPNYHSNRYESVQTAPSFSDDINKIPMHTINGNMANPQFQNYLYRKQKLHTNYVSPPTADQNPINSNNEWPSVPHRGSPYDQEQALTGLNHNHENSQHQQQHHFPPKRHMAQPDGDHKNGNNNRIRMSPYSNFLHRDPNNNNWDNVYDRRKTVPLENGEQHKKHTQVAQPHLNSFVSVESPSESSINKNKGRETTDALKIEYDFVDKDVNDTYETTMELDDEL